MGRVARSSWVLPRPGMSRSPNSVIPTGTDHRKAMIYGVEGCAPSEVEGDLVLNMCIGWCLVLPLRPLQRRELMQPASRFSTRNRRPHCSHLYRT
jgi:hypothetical protein